MRISFLLISLCLCLCNAQVERSLPVYHGTNGTLADGFLNWSWATVSLTSTDYVHTGDKFSISMVCAGWKGLYLSQVNPWSIGDYNTLSFWINGGDNGNEDMTITLTASPANSQTLTVADYILPNHNIPAKEWVQVKIPLDHFSLPSMEIKGFWFQANSNSGTSAAYFDDIAFTFENVPPTQGPNLTVDATAPTVTINPDIYGITIFWDSTNQQNFTSFAKEINLPLNRIGGDGMTRYNWQVDSSNSGHDWYWMGGGATTPVVPGATYDNLINLNTQLKARTVVTVPMIEYINKAADMHCSFPKSVYPNQQSYNPYVHPNGDDCGNGVDASGKNILDKDPLSHDIPNTPAIQQAWIEHISSKWGTADKSGIIYQLDNEVSNWAFMHRDVHPDPVNYTEIVNQTILYAQAIKTADAKAYVASPSEIQFAWYPDWNGDKNVIFFLQQLKQYDQEHGIRLLDSFDAHYPDADDSHWPTFRDVDHLRGVVDQNYPGTDISFSEWSMTGLGPLNGALATADELGHYAKNRVSFASYWGIGADQLDGTIANTYRVFRNYDGKGSTFGDKYVSSTTENDSVLSVHSAIRSSDGALVILVINKIAADQSSHITLKGFNPQASAEVFEYGAANEGAIVKKPNISVSSTGFYASFSSFSITHVILSKA